MAMAVKTILTSDDVPKYIREIGWYPTSLVRVVSGAATSAFTPSGHGAM